MDPEDDRVSVDEMEDEGPPISDREQRFALLPLYIQNHWIRELFHNISIPSKEVDATAQEHSEFECRSMSQEAKDYANSYALYYPDPGPGVCLNYDNYFMTQPFGEPDKLWLLHKDIANNLEEEDDNRIPPIYRDVTSCEIRTHILNRLYGRKYDVRELPPQEESRPEEEPPPMYRAIGGHI